MSDIIDLIILIIPVIALIFATTSGIYFGLKKLLRDLVDAIEDDSITKEELQLLIEDSLSIINIFKRIKK